MKKPQTQLIERSRVHSSECKLVSANIFLQIQTRTPLSSTLKFSFKSFSKFFLLFIPQKIKDNVFFIKLSYGRKNIYMLILKSS